MSSLENTASALVVEGGAMRSTFSAGILDSFLEKQFTPFDFHIGVSAGAYNLAAYLANEHGASYEIFRDVASNPNFINYTRFILGGHLLDLDWLVSWVDAKHPKLADKISARHEPLYICVTEAHTAEAKYIRVRSDNFMALMKATIALPLVYRNFPSVDGVAMTDGGVADGIPAKKAILLGAKKIMVIRSRPRSYVKTDTIWHKYIRWRLRSHSKLVQVMRERITRFEDTLQLIQHPPNTIKILEICPPERFSSGRFCKDVHSLESGYRYGQEQSDEIINMWKKP